MKYKFLTSMIIPTYNRPDSLGRTLDTLAKQTVKLGELIILDDSTDDKSKKVIDKYNKKINIVYIKKRPEERGTCRSGNIGIEKSRGRFVFMLEDDMLVTPDYVEASLKFFDKHPDAVGMNWFPYTSQKQSFNPIKNFIMRMFFLGHYEKDTARVLPTMSIVFPKPLTKDIPTEYMPSGTCVVKREYLDVMFDEKLTEYALQEDLDWSFRLFKKYGHLYLLKEQKVLHVYDLGGRMTTKKIIYTKIVYATHMFKKNFSDKKINFLIFWWGMIGRIVLRLIDIVLRHSWFSIKEFAYTFGAIVSVIVHYNKLGSNPDYFKKII